MIRTNTGSYGEFKVLSLKNVGMELTQNLLMPNLVNQISSKITRVERSSNQDVSIDNIFLENTVGALFVAADLNSKNYNYIHCKVKSLKDTYNKFMALLLQPLFKTKLC